MDARAKSEVQVQMTIAETAALDHSEVAVESCEWVREIAFIEGHWVTTDHWRGRIVSPVLTIGFGFRR
jgi:hypothetical protein